MVDIYISTFCKNMKKLREDKGMTKSEMAKRLNIGIGSLNKIEKGTLPSRLSCEIIVTVCNEFDILPSRLFD